MDEKVVIGEAAEVPAGVLKSFHAGGTSIVVARVGDGFCAASARCPHMGGPMARGRLEGKVITCPRHGSKFDMCSGENLEWVTGTPGFLRGVLTVGRQARPIRTYRVTEEGGKLYVSL